MSQQGLILITGATGFIGGHLALALAKSQCRLRLYVRNPEGLQSLLKEKCEIVVGDLTDATAISHAVAGVSVIFHCAANVNTWDSDENYFKANVLGTECLLAAVIGQGVALERFVHVSTMDVYGFPANSCDENAELQSCFGYGKSKIAGERQVRSICSSAKIPYVILRPGNVIGPGSQFIVRIGDALQSGVMALIDGGNIHAGLVGVGNLIEVLRWSASAPAAVNNCFNVRDSESFDWRTFINEFRARIKGHGVVISLPYRLAMLLGQLMGAVSGRLFPAREPLWHPLLVDVFGRTCGHDIASLQLAKGSIGVVPLQEALKQSYEWFLFKRKEPSVITGVTNE